MPSSASYIERNAFRERFLDEASRAPPTRSRIWPVYWSRPQVAARQHARMAAARRFLNGLWTFESRGDALVRARPRHRLPRPRPAPRAGRRVEGAGGPRRLAVRRRLARSPRTRRCSPRCSPVGSTPTTRSTPPTAPGAEVESPVGCTVFRTFQGWTALSEMQPGRRRAARRADPGGGRLPARARSGRRARAARRRAGPGAAPRRRRRAARTQALVPIPAVEPGDTVWWHGDLYHSSATPPTTRGGAT